VPHNLVLRADHAVAQWLYRESLTMAREFGNTTYMARALEGMAGVAAARYQPS
jgi:hypothetical protein